MSNFGMLIVDMSEVKHPGEANLHDVPPEYGQLIDGGVPGILSLAAGLSFCGE
jgi:hypothetical protein